MKTDIFGVLFDNYTISEAIQTGPNETPLVPIG